MSKKAWSVSALVFFLMLGGIIFLLTKPTPSAVLSSQTSVLPTPDITSLNLPTSVPMPTQTSQPSSFPAMEIDPKKITDVTLHTSSGDIVIELDTKNTPKTANNFYHLAKTGFYNNTIFHRVIKGFMIQGGDPTGTGTGGPGYKFADEYLQGQYTRGTVAMANSGPDTNGSQFFIMHADNALPNAYVIFGHVISGLDTVDKIATASVTVSQSGEPSSPVTPVTITSAAVSQK